MSRERPPVTRAQQLLHRIPLDRKCDRDTFWMRWEILLVQRLGIIRYHADRAYEEMRVRDKARGMP